LKGGLGGGGNFLTFFLLLVFEKGGMGKVFSRGPPFFPPRPKGGAPGAFLFEKRFFFSKKKKRGGGGGENPRPLNFFWAGFLKKEPPGPVGVIKTTPRGGGGFPREKKKKGGGFGKGYGGQPKGGGKKKGLGGQFFYRELGGCCGRQSGLFFFFPLRAVQPFWGGGPISLLISAYLPWILPMICLGLRGFFFLPSAYPNTWVGVDNELRGVNNRGLLF